ncbi:MAG: ferredoxin reductase [Actinomycetota bacterium]|nr:ferredoxin reductase [Actinomycetota bacterium]
MPAATSPRRLLGSSLVDLLLGPHGIDRYLELIRPDLTIHDARARVVALQRQTPRSVTLTLRPNSAWKGFSAGQYLRLGVDIDGVRRTRTLSPACSQHRADGLLEVTATVHPHGLVSRHLHERIQPGAIMHLGAASGSFTLPEVRPERLMLISGGSGITPVLAMLRTLCDEGHGGELVFVHYARTAADWLYRPHVEHLTAEHPGLRVHYLATREGGARLSQELVRELLGGEDPTTAHAAVCGPPALIDAVRSVWHQAPERVLSETFTPPSLTVTGEAAEGTLRFLRSDATAPVGEGTLLVQAEAAGLSPDFGCRMGICHTCTCRKSAGAVRNLLTGEVSREDDEDIQLCISVPAGDVALEL